MIDLSFSSQVPYTSRVVEEWGVGGGIFQQKPRHTTKIKETKWRKSKKKNSKQRQQRR